MIRGEFQLFACRSGELYAKKLVTQLRELIERREKELENKNKLTLHELNELQFINNLRQSDARLGNAKIVQFDDGEMNITLDSNENVRDKDVFLVQCPYNTINGLSISENILETFLFLDTLRRSKAQSITLISLYYPYGRGDKQHGKDGVPAKMLASLMTNAGMNSIITMDLHADQITGFFHAGQVNVEHLHASPLQIHYFKNLLGDDATIAAPDAGAAKRAQFFAQALQKRMLIAYKKRSYHHKHQVEELSILGLPGEDEVVIVDDIVSSGGSVLKVIEKLKEKGVKKVYVACTHALLIGDAIKKFDEAYADETSPFYKLIGTDAIPHNGELKNKPWYEEVDTSKFIAKAIYEIHTSGSVSYLHNPECVEKEDLYVKK